MIKAIRLPFVLVVLLASSGSPPNPAHASSKPPTGDEAAIKQVIEGHVAAFHARQADKNLSFWVQAPYVSHTYVGSDTGYVRGFAKLSAAVRTYMTANPEPNKREYRLSDFIIRVSGNAAWATFVHDQYEKGKRHSGNYEARYLEKTGGTWKIAAVVAKSSEPPAPPVKASK